MNTDANAVPTWPERPTCHDSDPSQGPPFNFPPAAWRTDERGFRTCSHCGSIHPEDLLRSLQAGAALETADWKYGWPHKFYVSNIPNANHGREVSRSSGSGPLPMSDADRARWKRYGEREGCRVEFSEADGRWKAKVFEPDAPTAHGKWYNVHLSELSPAAFEALAARLAVTGVTFARDERGVKWSGRPGA